MFDQFKNLKDLAGLLGNAGEMKQRFEQLQEELEQLRVEGEAGAGAVRVTVNGKMQVLNVELDPAVVGSIAGSGTQADRQMVEDLIVSACNAAMAKAQDCVRDQMGQMTGGMNLPGLDQLMNS